MATLLLRCVAPMQAWGTRSRFQERDTEREPTKSGIIGLLCAALGRDRGETLDDLTALRMGVRVDQEGMVEYDYHTALEVIKADGSRPDTQTSTRYYLADAAFLVGLESKDEALLNKLHQALKNPVWTLFLGRKSFVSGLPVYLPDGLQQKPLENALSDYPRIAPQHRNQRTSDKPLRLRLLLENPRGEERRQDLPIDFRHAQRRFRYRNLQTLHIKHSGESLCI